MPSHRIRYFDVLKGFTILWVVMGHVIFFGIGEPANLNLLSECPARMPLFFFVSGYLTNIASYKPLGAVVIRRAKQLLVPAIATGLIFAFYYESKFNLAIVDEFFFSLHKYGYWFPFVLFSLCSLFTIFRKKFNNLSLRQQIAVTAIVFAIFFVLEYFIRGRLSYLLSVVHLVNYMPSFMIGAITARHSSLIYNFFRNKHTFSICLLTLCFGTVIMHLAYTGKLPLSYVDLGRHILPLCAIVVGVTVVKSWCEQCFSANSGLALSVANCLEYLGFRSRAIYMLHYFFLFPLKAIRPFMLDMGLGINIPMYVFSTAVAAAIIAVCLLIDYILSFSNTLSLLFTGGGFNRNPINVK